MTNTLTQTRIEAYLEGLNWRYATKKFDPERKLSQEQLDGLLEALRLSASSYGLQPYRILVLGDEALRERLRPACWNQAQITEASHVLVLAGVRDFDGELIDTYLAEVSKTRKLPLESLSGYGEFMKAKLLGLSREEKATWAAKQAYIALGNLLSAAALMEVDACPMEGFDREAVDEILGLEEAGLTAALLVPVGFRSSEDPSLAQAKVRRPLESLVTYM